jgi:hypothetical protein
VIFWAVAVTHCWLRPVGWKMAVAGAAGLLMFMYGYGLYKGVRGAEGLGDLLEGRLTLSELEQRSEKPLAKVLLQDLGRGDVQALILQRVATGAFEPAGGRTYLAALAKIVPRALWPDRPPNKLLEGSELRFGPGAYNAGYVSHYVHGLAGEALINFGPLGVIPAFLAYGLIFGRIGRFVDQLHADDARMLLAPFLVVLSIIILVADLDNLLWFLIKLVGLPATLVYLASRPQGAPA